MKKNNLFEKKLSQSGLKKTAFWNGGTDRKGKHSVQAVLGFKIDGSLSEGGSCKCGRGCQAGNCNCNG